MDTEKIPPKSTRRFEGGIATVESIAQKVGDAVLLVEATLALAKNLQQARDRLPDLVGRGKEGSASDMDKASVVIDLLGATAALATNARIIATVSRSFRKRGE